jgi:hypothetical protein
MEVAKPTRRVGDSLMRGTGCFHFSSRRTPHAVVARVELSSPMVMSAHRAYLSGGWATINVKPRGRKRGDGRKLTLVR